MMSLKITPTFTLILFLYLAVNAQNPNSLDKNENNTISLKECYSSLKNAFKIIASPDKKYLFVLQNNNNSSLIIFKRDLYLKKLQTIEIPNTLDITITKDNKRFFLLSDNGVIHKYHFNTTKKKATFANKSSTFTANDKYAKGLIVISENEKFIYCSLQNKTKSFLKTYLNDDSLNYLQLINSNKNEILQGLIYFTIEDNHLYVYSWKHSNIGAFKINIDGKLQFIKFSSYKGFYGHIANLETSKKVLYLAHIAKQQYQITNPLLVQKNGRLTPLSKIDASSGSYKFAYPYKNTDNIALINNNEIKIKRINSQGKSSVTSINTTDKLQKGINDIIVLENEIYLLSNSNLCIYDIDLKKKKKKVIIETKLEELPTETTEKNIESTKTTNSDDLILAIRNHNNKKILKALHSGININSPDIYGATPLMWAFYFNQTETIKLLTSNGANNKNVNGGIYKDRNFESYYGNILSIAIERDFKLLKYAIEELEIPWNDQQFDIFTNKKTGHTALSSFLLKKIDFSFPYSDPNLYEPDYINSPNHNFVSNSMDEILDKKLQQMKLSKNDINSCEYLISQIQNRNEKKIYKSLLNYVITKDANILNEVIESLKTINTPYLKILLVDLMALSLKERSDISEYENVLELSKKIYGEFYPKTITHTFNLATSYINNRSYYQNKNELLAKAKKLLWKALRNRVTRYGYYHSLTLQVFDKLSQLEFIKTKNTHNEYSQLANKISEKLKDVNYGGSSYNQFSAYELQTLAKSSIDFNDFALHSNYYNNRFKSGFDRIQSYFPSLYYQSWSKSGIQKKYFAIDFMINYLNQNFDLLRKKSTSIDSTVFISEITNTYNALYNYRKTATTNNYYKDSTEEIDIKLFNLQLRIKGRNLLPQKKKLEFKDIKKTLTNEEAVVEIVRYNEFVFSPNEDIETNNNYSNKSKVNYIAYVVTKECSAPIMVPLNINEKNEKEFEQSLSSNGSDQKSIIDYIKKEETKLYTNIWKPLASFLKEKKQIYLCPDGILHQFPFDLLNNDYGNRVTKNFEIIRVVNSGNLVKIKKYMKGAKTTILKSNAVLIGNPDFNLSDNCKTSLDNKTEPLPETAEEINLIGELLNNKNWDVNILTGKNAKENILKVIESPTILHIASHGNYHKKNVKSPFDSFINHHIKLSGCDCNEQDKNKDGLLDGKEAQQMNLKHTQLVVLSACETGNGSAINSEGILGISKAFQIAGAESIISTLWKINSEITTEFMIYFYTKFSETNNKFLAFKYAKEKLKLSWGTEFSSGYIMSN